MRPSALRRVLRISTMTSRPRLSEHVRAPSRLFAVAATLALLVAAPACGDLDERDSNPPSVNALTRWDATHVLAMGTYRPEASVVDLRTGKKAMTLDLGRYYSDLQSLGDDGFVAVENQAIDFIARDGRRDVTRSIAGTVFTGIAIAADHRTLAYFDADDPTHGALVVRSLADGVTRAGPSDRLPALSNALSDAFALSRQGTLLAFVNGDVGLARTDASSAVVPCPLTPPDASTVGAAATLAFSPATDLLAVGSVVGDVELFQVDQGDALACRSVATFPAPSANEQIRFVRFSPDASLLAIASETLTPSTTAGGTLHATKIRVVAVASGETFAEFETYGWEQKSPVIDVDTPILTDLFWSDAGDTLTVAASGAPLQHWQLATATLLWELKL